MKNVLYPVPDPKIPGVSHVLSGTEEGIQALQKLLQSRFNDGYQLGLAQGLEAQGLDRAGKRDLVAVSDDLPICLGSRA